MGWAPAYKHQLYTFASQTLILCGGVTVEWLLTGCAGTSSTRLHWPACDSLCRPGMGSTTVRVPLVMTTRALVTPPLAPSKAMRWM
jgi:hypothetical protein